MTNPDPVGDAPNRKRDLIEQFHHDYAAIVAEANVLAEMTRTEGWQDAWAAHVRFDLKTRGRIADDLVEFAEAFRSATTVVEVEDLKRLGEARKQATEHVVGEAHYRKQVVSRLRNVVSRARECKRANLDVAKRTEFGDPMFHAGLEELMKAAVASVATIDLDSETGRLNVKEAPRG